MNLELIKKLEDQCYGYAGFCDDTIVFDKVKFAELIVRECARIARKEQDWNDAHELKVNIDQCILCDFGLK